MKFKHSHIKKRWIEEVKQQEFQPYSPVERFSAEKIYRKTRSRKAQDLKENESQRAAKNVVHGGDKERYHGKMIAEERGVGQSDERMAVYDVPHTVGVK